MTVTCQVMWFLQTNIRNYVEMYGKEERSLYEMNGKTILNVCIQYEENILTLNLNCNQE